MKPKNFPARKLMRKLDANRDRGKPYTDSELSQMKLAREVRTKKYRANI